MPMLPENLSQVTIPDGILATGAGALEGAVIVAGLKTNRYSEGAYAGAAMIALPITMTIAHGIGYIAGKRLQKII